MADQPHVRRRREDAREALTAPAATIAAIATAPGRGGIGVVRISGRELRDFAKELTGKELHPRRVSRTAFLDSHNAPIDDGLAVFFAAPQSYTGEDVLELHGHGGPVVLRLLLARCVELGAAVAEPGEFTRRAFLNDKLDLAQAEAVADLIDASTDAAARCALRSLRGEFSSVIDDLNDQLVELRMLVEATLDFPEEDLDPVDRYDMRVRLQRLRGAVSRALEQGRKGSVLRSGLTVVLAGRPNVGKSSLLNRLAGEDIAIVTPVPGTTRDAVRQTIQVGGIPLHIVDTAGLRATTDPVEALGIERTWAAVERADLVLVVADAGLGIQMEDQALLEKLPERLPRIIVLNKVDLAGEGHGGPKDALRTSAHTGEGLEALSGALLKAAGGAPEGEDIFMARERHLEALALTSAALARAERQTESLELLAEELRLAQRPLNSIKGEFCADDLLGEIFNRFCIGK
jgi:tRNA modification GTPase